ncbi:dimethylamine corrinoid protein [Treponema primitia ZAS-2]|uniref:Dimethylamine corrinoid protein n=1 Tax=Treponema primitia (strain ATCC BAA-887 / DSM 12427 / ZAS-2) TaxID=545694 RepID=F5YPE6_TREPZ|nr:cobalamin-dependent protein [Treponema primitia]AEF86217.1 dimethylamine corrinoid protein [Treponema primitia ZAS-2]
MSKIDEIKQTVETGKSKLIEGLVADALAEGLDPTKILNSMIDAMAVIGEKFQKAEVFVPEMLVAARTMKKGVEVLKPKLAAGASTSLGKCIIGTVHGDLHDIGKNLVALMIESAGFEVIDLGVDVTAETFLNSIKANPDVKVVALSCLLTTTMPSLKEIAAAVKGSPVKSFKLIIGGAPITQDFANQVGADGFTTDAAGAAQLAKKLAS